ncbi:MAG: hypothetical protein LUF87_07495 [Alistipes sp.]|nr:hypothetical protein [Alistipes sp.]
MENPTDHYPHHIITDTAASTSLLVCTGAPADRNDDGKLAARVKEFPGRKAVCGGTTSRIIARELGLQIEVELGRDNCGLPPLSRMDGFDLVTEGVLTLGRTRELLASPPKVTEQSAAGRLAHLLIDCDDIRFIVGTRLNPVHRDPSLPVELEKRGDIVREICEILRSGFGKNVTVAYL